MTTSKQGFTKGPWIVGTDHFDNDGYVESVIKQKDGPVYVAVAVTTGLEGTDQRAANAHLIASATELYEALSELVAWVGNDDYTAKARAALARAAGEGE